MDAKRAGWLPLWVLVPLVLFVVVLVLALSLPESRCGDEQTGDGAEGAVLFGIAAVAAIAAAGAGLFRLVEMILRRQYESRDGWILLGSMLVVAVTGVAYGPAKSFGAGVAIGCLALTGVALLALALAALSRRSVADVGILLPIYLFGAAYVYLATGAIAVLANSGFGC